METVKVVLTAIWEGVKVVPKTVWSFGLAFLFGFLLRGCFAAALALALAGAATADPPKLCPVNGANCTCGCLEDKTCNCVVKVDRPGWTQETQYYALVAGLKPGEEFDVFVNCDRDSTMPWVRWDAYPGLTGKWHVRGKIGPDGKPYVSSAVSLDPKPAQRFTSFASGGCAGGRCR